MGKKFKKWLLLTLAIFFVYDIVWIVTRYAEFRQGLNEDFGWVCSDLVFCGMCALVSIAVYSTMFDSKHLMRSKNNNGRHMLLMTGGLILLCNLSVAYGVDLLMNSLSSEYYFENAWDRAVMLELIASVLSMIFMTQYFADKMEQQNRGRMELQKKYLKLQLDPHFVFNNLSTLAGMISVEPEKAERYVVLLSHVYRYMLRHIDENIMSILDSKDLARKYIELLNLRFEDRIVLNMDDCKAKSDEFILAMSLQLLIENAVKHNTPQEGELLQIWISRNGNMLSVKNNRLHGDKRIDSYGLGMENLRQRCLMECGTFPKMIQTDSSFEVQMPILKRNLPL